MKKAIFLDRDGTINYDSGYVYKIEDLKILDGAKGGLLNLKNLGFLLILITNQSGIGRGYYSMEDCQNFNEELENRLEIKFDGIYICPHSPEENCQCRKPKTLNIENAIKDFDLEIQQCYFIGDKESDIQTGKNIGCKTVLIKDNKYECKLTPDYSVNTIFEFSNLIK